MSLPLRQFFSGPGGRRRLFGLLYVSEGAPMGFIWWALPSLLTARGMELATVAQLSAILTLPWVGKFVMGPVLDFAVRRGQRLRSWVLFCQLCMGLLLLPLVQIDWVADFGLLFLLLFAHGCFAATQDVAIDTLAIRIVPDNELGRINGWMQTGMLAGRASVSAGAVILVSAGYPAVAILLLIAIIWLPMLALVVARPDESPMDATPQSEAFFSWRNFIGPGLWLGLWVALSVGAGFEFFTVTAGPLLQSFGAEQSQVALLFGVVAPLGLAAGALTGGSFSARTSARYGTVAGMLLVALAVALIFALDQMLPELAVPVWFVPLLALYLATGFLIAASFTLLMQLSRGAYAATRFSLFMSATNGCESWAAFAGGRLAGSLGQTGAMLMLAGVSAVALPAIWLLSRRSVQAPDEKHPAL